MRNMRRGWIGLALVGVLGLGVGCGGSSGNGGDDSSGTTGFTAANLEKAGATGNETLSTGYSLAEFSQKVLLGWYLDTAEKTAARAVALPVSGVCTSGTLDVAFTDADESGDLSAGDTLVFAFSACRMTIDDEDLQFDGTVTVTAGVVNGWPGGGTYTLELGFSFQSGFSVSSTDGSSSLSGGFTYTESSASGGLSYQLGVRGEHLEFVETGDSGTYTTRLSDFSFVFTFYTADEVYTAEADGSVYDSDLGATVFFDTTTLFRGTSDENPSEGVMEMTADDNSRVTLTVLDNTRVELALDADGDGTPEQTVEVLWDDL